MNTFEDFSEYHLSRWQDTATAQSTISSFSKPKLIYTLINAMLATMLVVSPVYAERAGSLQIESSITQSFQYEAHLRSSSHLPSSATVAAADSELRVSAGDFDSNQSANSLETTDVTFDDATLAMFGDVNVVGSIEASQQVDTSVSLNGYVVKAIGGNGQARLKTFSELLPGWDSGIGAKLNIASVRFMNDFFEKTRLRADGASVFMSHRGNVMVEWSLPNGSHAELEFDPNGLNYYVEAAGEEGSVPYAESLFLAQKIERARRLS